MVHATCPVNIPYTPHKCNLYHESESGSCDPARYGRCSSAQAQPNSDICLSTAAPPQAERLSIVAKIGVEASLILSFLSMPENMYRPIGAE